MPPDLLDDALELDAGRVRRRASHEFVEASLKTCGISLQGQSLGRFIAGRKLGMRRSRRLSDASSRGVEVEIT